MATTGERTDEELIPAEPERASLAGANQRPGDDRGDGDAASPALSPLVERQLAAVLFRMADERDRTSSFLTEHYGDPRYRKVVAHLAEGAGRKAA